MAHTTSMNKKRHTKPCLYFQTGQCPFSAEDCDFAHVYDAAAASGPDALRSKYRTKPCRYYLQGSCSQGMWCRFKHPVGDWPRDAADAASGAESQDEEAAFEGVPDVRDVDSKWKRQRELHPKYKTRPCRDWLMGKCRRGASCSYLHPPVSPPAVPPTSPLGYAVGPYGFYPPFGAPPYGYAPDTDEPSDLDYSSSVSGSPPSDQEAFNVAHLLPPPPAQAHPQQPRAVAPSRKFSLGSALAPHAPPPPPGVLVQVPIPVVPMYANFYTQSAATQAVRPRSNSQPPAIQRRKSPGAKGKSCKHAHGPDGCPRGAKCSSAHDEQIPPVPALPASLKTDTNSRRPSVAEVPLPTKPKTGIDEQRDRGFYPIPWRVVGGGVKLGAAATEDAEARAARRRSPQEEKTPRPKPEHLPAAITPSISLDSSDGSDASPPATPVTAEGTPVQTPESSPLRPKRARHAKNLSISIPSPGLLLPLVEGAREDAARAARSTPSSPTFTHVEIHQLFSAELP